MSTLLGITILESAAAVTRTQIRFPRSKKRRIRQKWEQRECNFRVAPAVFKMGNTILCHPSIAAELRMHIP